MVDLLEMVNNCESTEREEKKTVPTDFQWTWVTATRILIPFHVAVDEKKENTILNSSSINGADLAWNRPTTHDKYNDHEHFNAYNWWPYHITPSTGYRFSCEQVRLQNLHTALEPMLWNDKHKSPISPRKLHKTGPTSTLCGRRTLLCVSFIRCPNVCW